MKDEWKFFLKYVSKEFIDEIKSVGKGFRNILRPKIWFFIFSVILILQLWHGEDWSAIGALVALLFIWGWDIYYRGAWKHEYRTQSIKKIQAKVRKEMREQNKIK